MLDVLIIGGGQAGLAAGYHAQRAGLRFTILEAGAQATGSWAHYYKSLKLFSPARYSSLPGLPFPGQPDRYPTRDEVIAYLQGYAAHFGLPITPNARVEEVKRHGEGFTAITANGDASSARTIIAATGAFNRPHRPEFAGQADFGGEILHSAAYSEPQPFVGRRVLVIGAGNSAVQVATELAGVADVTLTSRDPIQFRRQVVWGRDVHFWFRISGLDTLQRQYPGWNPVEVAAREILDTGKYRAALDSGNPAYRPLFERFTADGVQWTDGTRENFDTVVFATGFRPNLSYLAGLGALDEHGNALHRKGVSTHVPGVYYVGVSGQRSHASATLRGVGDDAASILRDLRKHLARPSRMAQAWQVLRGQPCCTPASSSL